MACCIFMLLFLCDLKAVIMTISPVLDALESIVV